MSLLKKYFLFIILIGVAGWWGYTNVYAAPCKQPIYYNLGTFDKRFNMTTAEFLVIVQEANQIWEKAVGKDLFMARDRNSLTINLIYDDRQALADKNRTLSGAVDVQKGSVDSIKSQITILQAQFKQGQIEYDNLVAQFKARQDAYNSEVRKWNAQGGAPKSEYERLNKEKAALATFQAQVENKRLEINRLADQTNALVQQHNSLVKDVNSKIDTINQHAGKEFEEGEYISDRNGKRIQIYEFANRQVLVRVLAHEFGHALGLDHNENPDSIMYYLNNSKNMKPTVEDIAAIKAVCRIK